MELFQSALISTRGGGGVRHEMPALFNVEGKLDVTPAHDLYIYPL